MRCQSQQSAAVLLQLMEKYKPHLKPYAYRLHSWGRVLQDYNEVMGTSYRQVRTIKNKFERLKYLYKNEPGNIHFKGYSDEQIRQLEALIRDSDALGKSSDIERMVKKKQISVKREDGDGDGERDGEAEEDEEEEEYGRNSMISPESQQAHLNVGPTDAMRQSLFSNGKVTKKSSVQRLNDRIRRGVGGNKEATPPPLDTIVMGMPKNTLPKSSVMRFGGLDIDFLVNNRYDSESPTYPDNPTTQDNKGNNNNNNNSTPTTTTNNDINNDHPKNNNDSKNINTNNHSLTILKSNNLGEIKDLVAQLNTDQAREDHEMAYKQQQLEAKFMTQADFLNYKKENRNVQLRILNLLSKIIADEEIYKKTR
ncbi:Protein DAL82 [Nakaseomyces bracarensis]|uniref:Protein DAL82 n=1 Tax=Nakaseomyces bracarensis TaxID=273131 RepID=A0ABR4NWL4_9SACH